MSTTTIKPTVGRIVWFYPVSMPATSGFTPPNEGQPLAAIITSVVDEACGGVHLTVFDATGVPHPMPYVQLLQEGEEAPPTGRYATWMPYQIGQAKKHAGELVKAAPSENGSTSALPRFTGGDFGDALAALKCGAKVARAGWNGSGQWIALGNGSAAVPAEQFWNKHTRQHAIDIGGSAAVRPYFILKTAQDDILMGWSPSQSDALAEDWLIVE